VPDNEIPELNIPTGIPLAYELCSNLTPVNHAYLGDPEQVIKAAEAAASQGAAQRQFENS
jgi:2,3-bisphosphoglycerate-dependent phosphoglycerate mutase